MSIFADNVTMPTFDMTSYGGDWRSKARANIQARENAMLNAQALQESNQSKIDTGMGQLAEFFNPKEDTNSDIENLLNVLSLTNQGADPTTVAAVNAAQEQTEEEEENKSALKKGAELFFADDEGSFTSDEAVGQNILQYPVVGGAMAAAGSPTESIVV